MSVSVPVGRYDLHTHSVVSDGTWTPTRIARAVAAEGLAGFALTDHDSTAGWAEARRAADEAGVAFIPGVELTTKFGGASVHLLGYLIDPDDPGLALVNERVRVARVGRAQAMVERLAMDYQIDWADVTAEFPDGATVGRPHIADALVRRGYFGDRSAAFRTILHPGSPYYVSNEAVDTREAVRLVRAAGGVPVLAHPAAARMRYAFPGQALRTLARDGLFGVELDHPEHDEDRVPPLRALAAELGLVAFGSSDFHGEGKPNRLGERTSDASVVEAILAEGTGSQASLPAA